MRPVTTFSHTKNQKSKLSQTLIWSDTVHQVASNDEQSVGDCDTDTQAVTDTKALTHTPTSTVTTANTTTSPPPLHPSPHKTAVRNMSNISRVLNDEPADDAKVETQTPKLAPITSPKHKLASPYSNPSLSKSDSSLDKTQKEHDAGGVTTTATATAKTAATTTTITTTGTQNQNHNPTLPATNDSSTLKRTLSSSSLSPALSSPSNLRFKRKKVPSDIRIYPLSKTGPPPVNSAPPTIRGFSAAETQPPLRTPVHAPNSANSSSGGSSENTPHTAHSNSGNNAVNDSGLPSAVGTGAGANKMYYVHPNGVQNPNAIRYYNLQLQANMGIPPPPGSQPPGSASGLPPYPGDARNQIPMVSPLNSAHPGGSLHPGSHGPHTGVPPGSATGLMTPQPHPHSQKPSPYSKVQVEDIYEGPNGPGVGIKTYHFPHYVELQASSPYASSFKKAGALPGGTTTGAQPQTTPLGHRGVNGRSSAPRAESEMDGSESNGDKKERFLKLCGEMWDLLKN
ncbi:YALI0B12606p [Yarrowia lipolytica CLIB122]|jgi:hypothetical protein|uniref:YALI0B12606p n=3 Tax=Yarrowia lipolytica TaxID=4952 RepID=Q6CEV4_YARLI|nr:YALI0B12606p [Yarrowia lipolytica CLIB122]AOW01609.1 hypothetical protein YALI1_B16645g [Yarrowia lipolytica]KAJ8052420.1 hypothetical protein LXG23DRAFT_50445 [Yarrowia lipolytica]CAG83059.1 YALI0B12606p [Yarrowia lipolytica CLIB122]SEI30942.1 YALIA101S01e11232g1_1 [Yarrowia lipolytica]VBB85625.1 Hypothetical protein conserved in the Yarrowia clade [Yarrowia lipolytica]|eukprot:XP_500808.1 YALI0B12606p [Yarrowia lipolytica CLIB122]